MVIVRRSFPNLSFGLFSGDMLAYGRALLPSLAFKWYGISATCGLAFLLPYFLGFPNPPKSFPCFTRTSEIGNQNESNPTGYNNWLVVSNIVYFYPYLGRWPNLTNIFQMGWNHQLDSVVNYTIFVCHKQNLSTNFYTAAKVVFFT